MRKKKKKEKEKQCVAHATHDAAVDRLMAMQSSQGSNVARHSGTAYHPEVAFFRGEFRRKRSKGRELFDDEIYSPRRSLS